MLSKFAQYLTDRFAELNAASQKAVVFVLGQPVVDAISNGYHATVNYLTCTGQAALDLIHRVLGF